MIHKGYFLLTDISGYTMFLTQSELEHADDILHELFDTLLKHIQPPLMLSNLQGDAILAYLPEAADLKAQTIIETIERLYFDFRSHLELMKINTSCTCNACANMSILDLKVFVHYGSYVVQEIGDKRELVGADVILAHRMMKNSVKEKTGLNGYTLITDAAMEPLNGATLLTPLIPHEEEYEHIGKVGMQIYPLADKWKEERERQRIRVDRDAAWFTLSREVPIPAEAAWEMFVDPDLIREWQFLDEYNRKDELGGRVQTGTKIHCVHGKDTMPTVILDWNPNEFYCTTEYDNPIAGLKYRMQSGIERTESGSRLYAIYEHPFDGPNLPNIDAVTPVIVNLNEQIGDKFVQVLNERIASGKLIVEPAAEPSTEPAQKKKMTAKSSAKSASKAGKKDTKSGSKSAAETR